MSYAFQRTTYRQIQPGFENVSLPSSSNGAKNKSPSSLALLPRKAVGEGSQSRLCRYQSGTPLTQDLCSVVGR